MPELMGKSKSQISKLEATVEAQKKEAQAKEASLQEGDFSNVNGRINTIVASFILYLFFTSW